MPDIKDYLHLYLGSETNYGELLAVDYYNNVVGVLVDGKPEAGDLKQIKLILRPLSDMTDDEMFNNVEPMTYGLKSLRGIELHLQAAELTRYLLSKHFDIFGLIDAGLAIDKSKLKTS